MKERISHWKTTVPGLMIIAGAITLRAFDKLSDEAFITILGVGGAGIYFKPKAS